MKRDLLDATVFFRKKGPRNNLYYLFPESRKGNRARYFRHLKWSLAIGVLVAMVLGAAIYFYNTR